MNTTPLTKLPYYNNLEDAKRDFMHVLINTDEQYCGDKNLSLEKHNLVNMHQPTFGNLDTESEIVCTHCRTDFPCKILVAMKNELNYEYRIDTLGRDVSDVLMHDMNSDPSEFVQPNIPTARLMEHPGAIGFLTADPTTGRPGIWMKWENNQLLICWYSKGVSDPNKPITHKWQPASERNRANFFGTIARPGKFHAFVTAGHKLTLDEDTTAVVPEAQYQLSITHLGH